MPEGLKKILIDKYGDDYRSLLADNPSVENLYMFSEQRAGLINWLDIESGSEVLLIGTGSAAIVKWLLSKDARVSIAADGSTRELLESAFGDEELKFINPERDLDDAAEFEATVHETDESLMRDASEGSPETSGKEPDTGLDSGYDRIICLFEDIRPDEKLIKKLKNRLKEGGQLVIAADNRMSAKRIMLGSFSENACSRTELKELISELGMEACWYYPVPDFRISSCIYSDRRLPAAGELAADIAAYEYPKTGEMKPGEILELFNRGGDFEELAPSYLITCGKRPDAVYIKHNFTRKPEYKLSTLISESDSGLRVIKRALNKEGAAHIASFAEKYKRLSGESGSVEYIKPTFGDDGMSAEFPYIEGTGFSDYIAGRIRGGEDGIAVIKEAVRRLLGDASTANLDSIWDNFILSGENLIGIDYEWVDEKPCERGYIIYRMLKSFTDRFGTELGLDLPACLKSLGVDLSLTDDYREAEREFQELVHGDEQKVYLDNYFVNFKSSAQAEHDEAELEDLKRRLEGIRAELKEKDLSIRKMTEVKRLTDNHVTNLEIIIGNLRNENTELAKTVNYLGRHEALIFRVRRKLGNIFNRHFPKGSIRRKKLGYIKRAVLNPAEYIRLRSTEEGRNLIEGDFKIGDIYRERGRLEFKKEENPKVSIIIPVYNQIHYTYACLRSILENTEGISYEIIIADDVSTDATSEISKFAANLIISRNTVNQGFLKNCNNAAKLARGEYLMFLNNDTKVTPGWLDSLVELIESDESIGMTGSKLVYPDGRLQEAGGIIWSDGSGWNYGRLASPDDCEYNYVKDVDYISGAAILIGRSLWSRIGGFDERYAPAYCEDSDLAFEVRKAGYRVCYQPKSVVIHFEGVSNGTDVQGGGLKRYQVENSVKLKEKWKNELALQCENNGNPDPFRARERSMGRKIILFVDHYVPTYDRDAGSKTTYQYLKMLVKKGYIVKFLGDNFLSEEPYTEALEQLGIEVLYGAGMQAGIWDWIKEHAKDIHLVYLNRPHIAGKYIDFIREYTDLKVIYYGHDLHFLREQREYELTGDNKLRESSMYWRNTEIGIMRKTDMNYYPSQVEADRIHEIDSSIPVKAITAYVYEEFHEAGDDFAEREGILFVGGFAHPPNADAVLWFVNEVWERIRKRLKINFYIAGSKAPEEISSLHNEENGIVFRGFVSDEELSKLYRSTRLVIVPLRYGAGVKGKVIEALHNGMPVLTTSVGAEGIADAKTVMQTADSAEEFAEALINMYSDTKRLGKMSSAAVSYIKKHNSTDAVWSIIEEDF